MRLKTLIATFLVLASGATAVLAAGQGNDVRVPQFGVEVMEDRFIPVPKAELPTSAPVLLAQTNNIQLEEQIRQLMGKVEELNFQVLQLQEQMRKMQEDNEFRFQELENSKQGGVKPSKSGNDVAAVSPEGAEESGTEQSAGGEGADAPSANGSDASTTAQQPKELGTITFDEKGNPVGGTVGETIDGQSETASLQAQSGPEDIYRVAYDHILAGEYGQAEAGFRQHIEQFPADAQTADARYWLGESLASQDKHREAAEILLDAQRDFPKSKKAPDMLLKLGISLAALDNKDVACATFNQVKKKYPKAGGALMERVAEEQAKTGC